MAQIVGLDSFINIGHFGKAAVSSLDFFDSPLAVASKLLTSAPAEKALPAPVITIDPIVESLLKSLICSRNSQLRSSLKAFKKSGLFKVMIPTLPICSTKIVSNPMLAPLLMFTYGQVIIAVTT